MFDTRHLLYAPPLCILQSMLGNIRFPPEPLALPFHIEYSYWYCQYHVMASPLCDLSLTIPPLCDPSQRAQGSSGFTLRDVNRAAKVPYIYVYIYVYID